MLYLINFIVPLFYLLILDVASFFVSEARGEKLGFKVTVLLSISVLLLILKDMLPSTEDKLPMIGELPRRREDAVLRNVTLTANVSCLILATFSVTIFALVGISVLEAMLVSFLTDLDIEKKTQRSGNVDIQLEADFHKGTFSKTNLIFLL